VSCKDGLRYIAVGVAEGALGRRKEGPVVVVEVGSCWFNEHKQSPSRPEQRCHDLGMSAKRSDPRQQGK
jgi:hypothetical protein